MSRLPVRRRKGTAFEHIHTTAQLGSLKTDTSSESCEAILLCDERVPPEHYSYPSNSCQSAVPILPLT